MVAFQFTTLLALCSVLASVVATPVDAPQPFAIARRHTDELEDRAADATITSSSEGTSGGKFYSFWTQANTGATMNIGTGTYSLSWSTASQNVVAGLGWNPGSARSVRLICFYVL
jgi:endo-1,4-beta-xylanase